MREMATVPQETLTEEAQRRFPRMEQIANLLKVAGVDVIDDHITPAILVSELQNMHTYGSSFGLPLTREGGDGIRLVITKRNGMIVTFTNGFEDKSKQGPIREKLQEAGLLRERE